MSRIKKILISAVISLVIVLISTYIVNLSFSKDVIEVPIVLTKINEGENLKDSNIRFVEVKVKDISKDIFEHTLKQEELNKYVASKNLEKGEILVKDKVIHKEEYLQKTEGLQYVSLPIKSATEGVSYKLKKGDKINVYYTAKKKAVDNILKSKIKVYSTNKDEAMVTCLLYQNVEIVALTNNMGVETNDGTATDIVVRLNESEILELANLKEQGIFTYSLI